MFQHLQWPFPVYMRCLLFSSYGAFWGANKSIISMVSFTKGLAKLVLIASISVMERLLDAQKGGGNCVFFSPFFEWECGLLGTPKERFEPRPSGMYFFKKDKSAKDLLEFTTWSDVPFSETHSFLVAFFLFGTWISRFQPLASPVRMLSEGLIRGLVKG